MMSGSAVNKMINTRVHPQPDLQVSVKETCLLTQHPTRWSTVVQMPSQFIGKLLRLGQQSSVQNLENEAALLCMPLADWLEEAEQHQVGIDLQHIACNVI